MYSVVLLMSMTAAPETPAFHGWLFHGCHGSSCHGCWSSCHGCWSSCHGCYGGGFYRSSCHGCYGGCLSTGGYGSYYAPYYGCQGYGIYGGANYAWPNPYPYGGSGCYGYGYPTVPAYPAPKVDDKKGDPKKTYLPASPNQGRVIVRLPADAKLFANGQLTTLTSSERDFSTPAIEPGRNFEYAMKIEYVRDGKTITDNQVVRVRAGGVSVVDFADRAQVVAAVTSQVTVRAPQGAKVFVENEPKELTNGVKQFQTPRIEKGANYAYSFRAELTKDGKTLTQTQRVLFKGGEPVNVDFTEISDARTASK